MSWGKSEYLHQSERLDVTRIKVTGEKGGAITNEVTVMSYEPEKPAIKEMAGGREQMRQVVPGMRTVNRTVPVPNNPMLGQTVKVLQQRIQVTQSDGGVWYEWQDVPTEAE